MGLTKMSRTFFVIFVSECLCKKTLQEQLHLSQRFYRQKLSVFVFRWIQGSDGEEGKIRLHVISFMEEMSVFPSVTKNSLYKLHGWSVGEVKQINY